MKSSTNTLDENFFVPDPPRPWFRRILIGAALVIVVAAAGWAGQRARNACGSPWSGISKDATGECIGVTDGSYVFRDAYADIEAKIKAENQGIGTHRAVTVAVLDPITPDASSALDETEIRHQIEGAYVAQHTVNAKVDPNGFRIKLVLANEGSHQKSWSRVADELVALKDDKAPLVAVTGLGVSVPETQSVAQRLSREGIPMVGMVTTADQLNFRDYPGFFRVSPSNRDYVESLKNYFHGHLPTSAILVYDGASDDPTSPDIFTQSLRDDFEQQMTGVQLHSLLYRGSLIGEPRSANLFTAISTRVCFSRTRVVLFAGRRNDLRVFLKSLEDAACGFPLTVMVAGSDLGAMNADAPELAKHKITVVYAAATDPLGWQRNLTAGGGYYPPYFAEFLAHYQAAIPSWDLADGEAMAGYDAVTTVATALDLFDEAQAGGAQSVGTNNLPTAKDVMIQLLSLDSAQKRVRGASGDIAYARRGPQGRDSGDPIGKPIPVLQIPAAKQPSTKPYITH